MSSKIVIAGGGTGGHIMPGLALAEEFAKRGCEVLWIGADGGLESELVPKNGFEYKSNGMKRISSGFLRLLRKGIDAYACSGKVCRIFKEFKPDAVIGLGGYAAVPSLLAASRMSVPFFLLEQNVIPGKVTRWFSKKCKCVFSQFAEAREYLPKRTMFEQTGSPIRKKLIETINDSEDRRLGKVESLLILGGSQGSRAINNVICESIPEIELNFPGCRITHIAGSLDFESVKERYENRIGHKVLPFHNDMGEVYANTTVAVARAGAVSLAELSLVGIPVILVPLPTAADNHQAANANVYSKGDAAVVINQSAFNTPKLVNTMSEILRDPTRRKALCDNILSFARPGAAQDICDKVLSW